MERERISPAVLWRLALGVALLLISAACGSTGGCQGCTTDPIPGGFPQEHRFDNAMQVRLSQSGVTFMEQNFKNLITTLVPGGLSFDIPPTGCSGGSQKICCSGPPCTATMDITSVQITPTPQSTAKLALRATVKTNTIKFEQDLWLGWISCDVNFNSAASGKPDLGLNADIDLVVDANDDNKLKIVRGATSLVDFDSGDIDISGNALCTIVDWLKGLFKGQIEDALMGTVDDTLTTMLQDLPMGQEGQFDVASFMSSFSPGTSGVMNYLLWAGGYAEAENSGMSVGVMAGFRAAQHHGCVPNCEAAGASCTPPQKAAISRSQLFRGNTRPDGQTFDVGIGAHRQALDQAAYGLYSSGGICLDVSSQTVAQLSSALFALMVPSLNTMTGGKNMPMMLSIRPRKPPTVELGKGTYHTDAGGKVVIDEPLVKIKAKDFAADVYVLADERYIRLFSIVGDLEVPALLFPDADGKLQPILGDLTNALTNIKIENNDLVTEDPESLKQLFPTLIGLAATFLSGGFEPIELPAIQGMALQLDSGSITSVENNEVLAIFAKLAMIQTTSGTIQTGSGSADTEASVEQLVVPPTEAFQLGPGFDPAGGPAVTLALAARLPPALAGRSVEYSYRVDGGFFHPWTSSSRIVVQDPLFWLQGRHTIEVMARVPDAPATIDPTPARLSVMIDTVAPRVRLVPTASGVRAEIHDVDRVELSWSVNNGAFGPFGDRLAVEVPPGTPVAVRVRDASGHLAQATLVAGVTAEADSESGGCNLAGPRAGFAGLAGLLVLLGLLGWRRRGR
jgi:hypothetical protein